MRCNVSMFSGADRIEMLGYDIIHLISHGCKEDFNTIIEKLEQGSLMEYLFGKYNTELCFVSFDKNSPYDPNEWEKVLDEYSLFPTGLFCQLSENNSYGEKQVLF